MFRDAKRGCQAKINEFIEACKSSSEYKGKSFYGCIGVYYCDTCVNKMWGTMCALIHQVNEMIRPFLQILEFMRGRG